MSKKVTPTQKVIRRSSPKATARNNEQANIIPIGTWVSHMHDYYRANGHYHPADLNRLLGDPRERAEISISAAMPLASLLLKS